MSHDRVGKIVFITYFLLTGAVSGEQKAGLILSGVDTISTSIVSGRLLGQSFDFMLGRPCGRILGEDPPCKGHIGFNWSPNNGDVYVLLNDGRRYASYGKVNLDSIGTISSDADLTENSYVFKIAPDSLDECIGNTYVVKTAYDSRQTYPMYAKLRILDFHVTDSVQHLIEMKFLWACQLDGTRRLATTGLDTFRLEDQTPTIAYQNRPSGLRNASPASQRAKLSLSVGRYGGLRVVRGREVFDVRGRKSAFHSEAIPSR